MTANCPQSLLKGLDSNAVAKLVQAAGHDRYAQRYGDPEPWILRAWKEAVQTGLHRSAPVNVLDIGTGPGYFPYVCQYLGHRCVGLDLPDESPFCQSLRSLLRLRVVEHEIRPHTPLPGGLGRFDLVTAFRAHFHYSFADERVWNLAEWTFFFDDLRDHFLEPDGRLALKLNRLEHRRERMPQTDDELSVFMAERGAKQHRRLLLFAPLL